MKKIIPIILLTLIIPQIALAASWWNPFSWNWAALLSSKSAQPSEIQAPNMSVYQVATTSLSDKKVSKSFDKDIVKKPANSTQPPVSKNIDTPTQYTAPTIATPNNTMACNGKNWQKCPDGSSLICPQSGDAYCQPPVVPQQKKDGYQTCKEKYQNSTWNGTYRSDGGFNCVCQSGYELNADGTSCQYSQSSQSSSNQAFSPECQSAKNALAEIDAEIKPLQDAVDQSMQTYYQTGKLADTSSQDSQLASLAVRKSGLAYKVANACYGVYPIPQKTYNTNCYGTGGNFNCLTQ